MSAGRILVTGGAGYIGSTLVGLLLRQNRAVRVVDCLLHPQPSLLAYWTAPGFDFLHGDLLDPAIRTAALRGVDAVVHLAALVGEPACNRDPARTMAVNLEMTTRLVEEAGRHGARRFVFASTCSNYGITGADEICTELTPTRAATPYAISKVRAEDAVLCGASSDLVSTVLRFATIFGVSPRMRFDLIVNDFTKAAWRERRIEVYDGHLWRPQVHVADAARAIAAVLGADDAVVGGQIFNAGSDAMNYRKVDICQAIEARISGTKLVEVASGPDKRSYRVSFEKIRKTLGFDTTRDVDMGVTEIAALLGSGVIADPDAAVFHN